MSGQLMSSVLRYSRNEVTIGACPIHEVFEGVFQLLGKRLRRNKVNLTQNVDRLDVYGIPSEIGQVLMNLVKNAVDCLEGSATLNRRIMVNVVKEHDMAKITVEDNGGGIKKDIIGRIFQRGFSTKGSKGSGVGLFITKRLVEKNRGEISVCNTNDGCRFTVCLPIYQSDPDHELVAVGQ